MSTARTWIRICVLIVSLVPAIAFARLDASVDSTAISAADTIRLTLRADSTNITGEPNLDALSAQFDVLDTQRNSQFQSINGQVSAWTTWTLTLKPKHTGTLTIPPISVGNDTSQPISITVKDLDPQLKSAIARTVFFETTYEPKQVYVQSQIIITRRLFYLGGAQLYGNMPDAPDIPGAMVESLGDASRSTAIRDGRQYGVIEQRFAAFPERSGTLKIPTTSVTGSVRLDDGMGGRRVGIDVTSEPLSIAVLPIPPDYPRDTPWLPASDVELVQDWPGEPARGLATGTPSQRTLIVRADGNTASAIPPLKMRLPDSIKAYPEPPKMNETQGRSGIIGTRTESTSLVATQPGSLTLPEVSVTWFDTVHRQVKICVAAGSHDQRFRRADRSASADAARTSRATGTARCAQRGVRANWQPSCASSGFQRGTTHRRDDQPMVHRLVFGVVGRMRVRRMARQPTCRHRQRCPHP